MNIFRLLAAELVVFHICLGENFIFRNDEPPKAGFGEYIISLQSLTDCNSTEKNDQIIFDNFKINFLSKDSVDNALYMKINVEEKRVLNKIHCIAELWKYGKFSKLFEQSSDNICMDPVGKKLVALMGGIKIGPECILNAGNYTSPVLRPNEVLHHVIGNKFFYGLAKATVKTYTDKGLGFCKVVVFTSKPKTQKKNG